MRGIKDWPLICRRIRVWNIVDGGVEIELGRRCYSTRDNLRKIRPMILKRIEERAEFYPVKDLIPVAREVLQARSYLIHGVSTLIRRVPVLTCKFCPEVYIGEKGHLIRTCIGSKCLHKNMHQHHQWIEGSLNDIVVPVETFHLDYMFQGVIKHDQRFDYDRISAVSELCWQAGANPYEKDDKPSNTSMLIEQASSSGADSLSDDDLTWVAVETLRAWETLMSGVKFFCWFIRQKFASTVLKSMLGLQATKLGFVVYLSTRVGVVHTFGRKRVLMIWCHLRLCGGGGLKTLLYL